jgi:hypothetical protein
VIEQVAIGLPIVIGAAAQDVGDFVVTPPVVCLGPSEHCGRAAGDRDHQVLTSFGAADEIARVLPSSWSPRASMTPK